jgi:hypothetical protein
LTHPSRENHVNVNLSKSKSKCRAEQILGNETPETLHHSFDDFFPAENGGTLHRKAIINGYRLDYTESPRQDNLNESENLIGNQSFLATRPPGQSNL